MSTAYVYPMPVAYKVAAIAMTQNLGAFLSRAAPKYSPVPATALLIPMRIGGHARAAQLPTGG